jgi:hypothetical protein
MLHPAARRWFRPLNSFVRPLHLPMLAGEVRDIHPHSGEWVFVDIGFSREGKTAGLLISDGRPSRVTFSDLRAELICIARRDDRPLNLVVEAPLSVAFTASGNPAGRSMEKGEQGHRYWYAGLGCQVTTAATYLLRAVLDAQPARPVRLFEAFVTFKPKGTRSSHERDVEAMRSVVWRSATEPGDVVAPNALRGPNAERLQSAFAVSGFDLGVPPVIVARAV